MRHLRNAGLAVLVLALSAGSAAAQGRVWEWGMDFFQAALGMDPSSTTISCCGGELRAGVFMSDAVSVEPRVGVTIFSNGTSFNSLGGEVGVLWHAQTDRNARQIYVRPLAGFSRFSSSGTSSTDKWIGAGVGIKRPMRNKRFSARAEVNFQRMLANGAVPASNSLNLLLGGSVYNQ